MVQITKFINSLQSNQRYKAYESMTKYADKIMLKKGAPVPKLKHFRYYILAIYFLHGFKVF